MFMRYMFRPHMAIFRQHIIKSTIDKVRSAVDSLLMFCLKMTLCGRNM
jgi:hypothetical protein